MNYVSLFVKPKYRTLSRNFWDRYYFFIKSRNWAADTDNLQPEQQEMSGVNAITLNTDGVWNY